MGEVNTLRRADFTDVLPNRLGQALWYFSCQVMATAGPQFQS